MTGPLKGLFVCKCGKVAGPRPLYEAIKRNIPFDLWVLIHRSMLDKKARTKVAQDKIEQSMIKAFRCGKMQAKIQEEENRRLCINLKLVKVAVTTKQTAKLKVAWRSKENGL